MTEAEEFLDVQRKLDAAQAKLDAAELVWRKAQREYTATVKPLGDEKERLLCNSGEWPDADVHRVERELGRTR